MNICITGGSGFLGTRLLKFYTDLGFHLQNIDKNQSPDFPSITTIQDIRDRAGLNNVMLPAEFVVHLAAEHKDDVSPVSLYYDVNVQGTKNVLDAMDRRGITRIIFVSTVAVYGLNKDDPDENSIPAPFNHYGKSKQQAEELIQEWQQMDINRHAVILRPSVIFGETNRGNVYNLLRQISSGRFMMIGAGKNKKSMAYVGNVAAFISFLSGNMQPGCTLYNYTDLPDLTTNELVSIVREELKMKVVFVRIPYVAGLLAGYSFDLLSFILRKKFTVSSIRIRKFCATTRFNSEKAHKSGFKAPYLLKQALQRTIQFEFSEGILKRSE
jgi:GlcNAc-P-P-Und epimerase